jgi:hypothetical protein
MSPTLRCHEEAKHDNGECYRRGTIRMAVEGTPALVEQMDIILKKGWNSALVTEEGEKEGTIAVFFLIKRHQKADFLADYHAAKPNLAR